MISEKQLVANQQNALKSTGPQTAEGKEIVCKNAIRHGILCKDVVIEENEQEQFDIFRLNLMNHLSPIGELELFLVERIISSAWRLKRVIQVETLIYQNNLGAPYEKKTIRSAFVGNISCKTMTTLSRYEVTLEKSLYKALAELKLLQANDADDQAIKLDSSQITIAAQNGFVSQNESETLISVDDDCTKVLQS